MSRAGALDEIQEALSRVGWVGEEQLVRNALRNAIKEIEEIQVIEVEIVHRGRVN